jgi:hypothetical protein
VILNLERILAQCEPSEEALSSLQKALEEEARRPLLLTYAQGQRAKMDSVMQAIEDGKLAPSAAYGLFWGGPVPFNVEYLRIPGMAARRRAEILRNNRIVEIAKLPIQQQIPLFEEFEKTEQNVPQSARWIRFNPLRWAERFYCDHAYPRCAIAMLAAERYRRGNGRWPETLADLVPRYLPKTPFDPFDGAPLRYRREEEGIVIYSVGPDRKYGGRMRPRIAWQYEGTWAGWRLWDPVHRRQPAKSPFD